MGETIGAEEALKICHSATPTEAATKKVLAWAEAAPDPSNIRPLLQLETNNYASRKGLDEAFHRALSLCAQGNTSALWECVEGDWEKYRVLHAIRAIGDVGSRAELERLIELGKTHILRIHWSAIAEIARVRSISIPEDVASAQALLEKERGPADFEAVFLSRKPIEAQASTAMPTKSATRGAKPSRGPQTQWPAAFSADAERNPFLKAYKQTRQDKWTLTRMEPLFEEVDLAWFLFALGRNAEALAVVRYLSANVTDYSNKNIWTPVGYGICLEAHILRTSGELDESLEAVQRIVTHRFMAIRPRSDLENLFDRLEQQILGGTEEGSLKTGCRKLARALDGLCYYLETGAASLPGTEWYPVVQLEQSLSNGLERLRFRLQN